MKNPVLTPEIRELLSENEVRTLREFCTENHPGMVAELLGGLEPHEIWQILMLLDVHLRAEIFAHFDIDQQVELVSGQNRRDMATLLEEMPPDDRAELVRHLDEDVRDEILPLVAKAEREDIRKLVAHEEGTAGAVMSTEYAALRPDITVAQAVDQLRIQAPDKETIYYIYVVNEERQLIGFVSLKDLILSRPYQLIKDVMHPDAISVKVDADQEHVAREIEKYDLIAIPVVDDNDVLVGIVTHDDAVDIIRQEEAEDIEKFMAIGGRHETGEYLKMSPLQHYRKRFVWIIALATMGLVSGTIVQGFEDVLATIMVLAFFMPMLADTGGNTGSQAATLVVRALALGELTPGYAVRVFFKELRVGLMLGFTLWFLVFGIVFFVITFVAGHTEMLGGLTMVTIATAIATAIAIQVVSSTLIGAMLPIIVSSLKLDPAIVASPAITTFVDITGLMIYFGVAKIMLGV